jgi:hypothetical protein
MPVGLSAGKARMANLAGMTMLVAAFGAPMATAQPVSFGGAAPGTLPAEFEIGLTGSGPPPRWEVAADPTALDGAALVQVSDDATNSRFPLAIYKPVTAANLEASVRFKAISGKVDQAGGIAVRLVDSDNYYVTRANALEGNVRFYRVVDGQREQLAGASTEVTTGEWHTLSLRAVGNRFTVTFDDTPLLAQEDTTFDAAGRVALWTKADSVTAFDTLQIKSLD